MKKLGLAVLVLWTCVASERQLAGQQAAAGPAFDAEAATRVYLATVPPEKKARSDAYFEGGYWLVLWGFLATAGVSLLLLATRWSAAMRNFVERATRRRPVQSFLFMALYSVVTAVILFPFSYYRGFVREHKYGLSTQNFGAWMGDRGKGFAVTIIFGGVFLAVLYGVLRRSPKNWWIWGALTVVVFLMFGRFIAPVYVNPLFNKYTRLDDPKVRDPILSLARANGIGVKNLYVMDASRQSTRISANVSGFLGTERITLNDNLLKRCTLPEIEAVMGHEMGHYVLNHVYKGALLLGVLTVIGFGFVKWGFDRLMRRYGERWDVRGVGDLAGLPMLVLLLACYTFALTPVLNTLVRTQEYEADIFGLNAAAQPEGFAQTALKLSDYRKLDPTPLEEAIFFDHPSGHTRILSAMRWKAEHAPRLGR